MPRSLLHHASWLGIAVCAFFGGHWLGSGKVAQSLEPGSHSSFPPPSFGEDSAIDVIVNPIEAAQGTLLSASLPEWFDSGEVLSVQGMREAASEVLAEENVLQRELLFPQLLIRLTEENAWGLWDVFKQQEAKGAHTLHAVSLFGYAWGKVDGESAMDARYDNQQWGPSLAARALEGWSAQDPDDAMVWVEDEQRSMSKSLRNALLTGLAASAPEKAAAYLVTLEETTDPSSYVKPVVVAQMKQGFSKAESWVENLPSDGLKGSGWEHLAKHLADEDLEQALAWGQTRAADPVSAKAMAAIAERVINDGFATPEGDHKAAIDWLETLPEGVAKNAAYAKAVRTWARRKPNNAGEFLGQLPNSPAKDQAIRAFSLEIRSKDPEVAVLWANTIGDAESRQHTIVTAARHWHRVDPQRTMEWLQQADLPADVMKSIVEP